MRSFKVGSIVFATESGLGRLAKSFYDNGVLDKVLIYPHSCHKEHPWFPNSRPYSLDNINWLLDVEKLLFFETPFNWKIIPMARERGIKTILMPDECTPYPLCYEPDVILCPSLLENTYNKGNCVNITIPVDVKWKLRKTAAVFVHNAGHGGLAGRNGTKELLEAMKYVKSPIKLIIRTQSHEFKSNDPRVEIRHGTFPYEELYTEGDVFIFPDKFAGLSLPLQEAFASGMLVMASDRFPLNTWLPKEPLIPVRGYKKERIAIVLESAIIDPQDIAECIDFWYNEPIEKFSLQGKVWAKRNSWQKFQKKNIDGL